MPESWTESDGSQAVRSANLCTYAADEESCNKALHVGQRGVRYGETWRAAITYKGDTRRPWMGRRRDFFFGGGGGGGGSSHVS